MTYSHLLAAISCVVRQRTISTEEASLPLRRVLADNGARRTAADAERLGRRQLAADKVGIRAKTLTQRAEESPARAELEEEARARSNDQSLVCSIDIGYDYVAVGGCRRQTAGERCAHHR